MWINWTHEAAFAKSRLTENSIGCVASQHNYIAVQFRYKLGHGSVNIIRWKYPWRHEP
jgi:hypothetical protein